MIARTRFASILVAALLVGSLGVPTLAAQEPNGIYAKQERLDRRLAVGPSNVEVFAVDNANTRFQMWIEVPHEPEPHLNRVLVVGGKRFPQTSAGSSRNGLSQWGFRIDGREAAEFAARLFGTPVRKREHPGNRLRVQFEPVEAQYRVGEAVKAQLRIMNLGAQPIAFLQGGQNRGQRDSQYHFSARHDFKQVADHGSSLNFGGLAAHRVVAPGEEFTAEVDLSDWFAFDEPGSYEVLGSWQIQLLDPGHDEFRPLWDDWLTDDFVVEVARRP
ncbi:MAG TPA: hypothetical protein VGC54_09645 [Planctomycetota bacterium]